MSKYSQLADRLGRYKYEGPPEDELGRLVALLSASAAALRELEAERDRLREALHRVRALTDANCDEAFNIVCAALERSND